MPQSSTARFGELPEGHSAQHSHPAIYAHCSPLRLGVAGRLPLSRELSRPHSRLPVRVRIVWKTALTLKLAFDSDITALSDLGQCRRDVSWVLVSCSTVSTVCTSYVLCMARRNVLELVSGFLTLTVASSQDKTHPEARRPRALKGIPPVPSPLSPSN